MLCEQCPRKCKINRDKYLGNGFCKVGYYPKIARIAPHFDEEPIISGANGSGAIFFSGCNLHCEYCQNYEISCKNEGKLFTPRELASEIIYLEATGVHNIDFITGSHYIDSICETLNMYKPHIPVIYNSSGYDSVKSLEKLKGKIDVYLPDFKYANDELSFKYSHAKDYKEIAIKAIEEMIKQVGSVELDENGLIKKGIIIRHLILPNHTQNSIDVLHLIKDNFGDDVKVSLMCQYTPCYNADKLDINRKITKREYEKVFSVLDELNLDGFAQELSSADKKYIPDWNLK